MPDPVPVMPALRWHWRQIGAQMTQHRQQGFDRILSAQIDFRRHIPALLEVAQYRQNLAMPSPGAIKALRSGVASLGILAKRCGGCPTRKSSQ